jgi:uncharacterized YigZ family protein
MSFLTLSGPAEAETRVRGSRFLAIACPAGNEAAAREILDERHRRFHDASHHCAAWRLRDGAWRALDAGEPSGSAGAPILAAIDAAALVDTAVVVTRYFGGTKLGVGGLVRAYGEAAALALDAAPRRRGVPARVVTLDYDYERTAPVMRALERFHARDVEYGYREGGDRATVTLTLAAADVPLLEAFLDETTGATVPVQPVTETVLYLEGSH